MAETFLFDTAGDSGTTTLRFCGELDVASAPRAKEAGIDALAKLNGDGASLVIDLAEPGPLAVGMKVDVYFRLEGQ